MDNFKVGCQYDSKTRLREYERLNRDIRRNVDFVEKIGIKPIDYDYLRKPIFYIGSVLSVFHSNARIALQSKGIESNIVLIEGEMELSRRNLNQQATIECIDADLLFFKRKGDSLEELAHNHTSYTSIRRNIFHIETDKTFLLDQFGEYIIENFRK